ncbi:MAG TPA: crosslink repair DNA glycosylase YcaQ family protein [Candidatus Limnocylindria bacterium]|nr:crosslink repair DNA glycosylase YcaQ family protein [Candidatus Limnocylindria bacterium]
MTTELTAAEARTLALHAQGFIGPRDPDVRTMLRRVGAVQLDTISVLARSHELVAYARLGPVDRAAIEGVYWGTPPRAFEGIAHAYCVLPMELWPHLAARRRLSARRWHPRRPAEKQAMRAVLAALKARGPLTASDLGGSRSKAPRPENVWWHWSAEKIALERLLGIGEIVCVERRQWRRVYDLAERAVPARLLATHEDDPTCHETLITLAADRLGVGTLTDLRGYFGWMGVSLPAARAAIERAGLVPVTVRGWNEEAWASRRALRALAAGIRGSHRTALISPFDSLIWDRPRTARIFAYAHKFEAYVKAPDRVHGYFVMPVLAGGKLVGRVDPGRVGTTLVAKRVSGEPAAAKQVARALVEAARWVGCDDVSVAEARPAPFKAALRAALKTER